MRILVTGGAGFIGSAFIRHVVAHTPHEVVNVDKLTYAAVPGSLDAVAGNPRYSFEQVDITNGVAVRQILRTHRPDAVVHLAAESHVDRSIDGPADFVQTNIVGTYALLEAALDYHRALEAQQQAAFRFHHVSTDEVYGSLGSADYFTEASAYAPNSPYSASKAASDHLVRAWHRTYGLPVIVTNCSNNYGPYQFPEKLIPLTILNALDGSSLPVYGNGENVRDWLFVDDHARALERVLTRGIVGEQYNVGGRCERRNIDVVRHVCRLLDELVPGKSRRSYAELISFVPDRPGHDLRYAIDPGKLESQLGWKALETFESGLRKTIEWYLANPSWCARVRDPGLARSRRGLARGGRL